MSETFTSLFSKSDREEMAKNRRVEEEGSQKPEDPIKQEEILSDEYLNSKIEEVKDLGPLAVDEISQAITLYKTSMQDLARMKNTEPAPKPELIAQILVFAKVNFERNVENIKRNLPTKPEPKITTPEITPEPAPELTPAPKPKEPEINLEKFKLEPTPEPETTPESEPFDIEKFKKDYGRKDQEKQKQGEEQEQEKVIDSSHMLGILLSLARTLEDNFKKGVLEGQLENNPDDEKLKTLYAAYNTMEILGPEYLKEKVILDVQTELDEKIRAIGDRYRKALKDSENDSTSIKQANLAFEEDVKELKDWMDDKIKSL